MIIYREIACVFCITGYKLHNQIVNQTVLSAILTGKIYIKMTDTTEISKMDSLSDSYYALLFKNAYLEKKGAEFESWFAELAGHAFGSDFEEVSAHGNQGDRKCDGRLVKSGTIFQCYAPKTFDSRKTISKINADFAGAKKNWTTFMKVWIFVNNNQGGTPVTIIAHIDKLRAENPTINIKIWSKPQLYKLFMMMNNDEKRLMFGDVPNQTTVQNFTLAHLASVIDGLQKSEPDPRDPLPPPPSARKLEKNALSKDSARLLSLGRRKVKLVENFFTKAGSAEHGEQIAQSFRNRYDELKAFEIELDADTIFTHLHKHVGVYAEPAKKVAAMAILAYFFDSCDIFEDPTEEDTVI